MSETVNQETNATNEQAQPKAEEKLFTQEEVNGFFNKRYSEMMSQLEEFKDKAAKYDALEESQKTELQRATERAEKLESELNGLKRANEIKAVREKVAKETGIPAASYSLLTGETEEACQEQAKAILSMITPGTYPVVPDGGETVQLPSGSAREAFKQWAQATNT